MSYKLTYFNGRGLAETIRFLFKYGDIEFEDNRIQKPNWPDLKPDTPFGQLPVLEKDGREVGQSTAIARYVAKLVKLNGKDEWEDLQIDAVVDTFNDLRSKLAPIFQEQDPDKKKALLETALTETFPFYFSRLDALVEKNDGYLVGGHLTWADFLFAAAFPTLDVFTGGDALEKYPNLKALKEKVFGLPPIKAWIDVRPQSDF